MNASVEYKLKQSETMIDGASDAFYLLYFPEWYFQQTQFYMIEKRNDECIDEVWILTVSLIKSFPIWEPTTSVSFPWYRMIMRKELLVSINAADVSDVRERRWWRRQSIRNSPAKQLQKRMKVRFIRTKLVLGFCF